MKTTPFRARNGSESKPRLRRFLERRINIMQPNPVVLTITQTRAILAEDIGERLANAPADEQAAILIQWSRAVALYSKQESWAMQCRNIAEQMTNEECGAVRGMLSTLIEHLEAIPK